MSFNVILAKSKKKHVRISLHNLPNHHRDAQFKPKDSNRFSRFGRSVLIGIKPGIDIHDVAFVIISSKVL